MCLLTKNIFACEEFTVGGISKLFITNKDFIADTNYGANDQQYTMIMSLVAASNISAITWYEYIIVPGATNYTETMIDDANGKAYTQIFTTQFNGIRPTYRTVLGELINANSITLIFKDCFEQWWIMGDEHGARVTKYDATPGANVDENNRYAITLQLNERHRLRALDNNYVNTYIIPLFDVTVTGNGSGQIQYDPGHG